MKQLIALLALCVAACGGDPNVVNVPESTGKSLANLTLPVDTPVAWSLDCRDYDYPDRDPLISGTWTVNESSTIDADTGTSVTVHDICTMQMQAADDWGVENEETNCVYGNVSTVPITGVTDVAPLEMRCRDGDEIVKRTIQITSTTIHICQRFSEVLIETNEEGGQIIATVENTSIVSDFQASADNGIQFTNGNYGFADTYNINPGSGWRTDSGVIDPGIIVVNYSCSTYGTFPISVAINDDTDGMGPVGCFWDTRTFNVNCGTFGF